MMEYCEILKMLVLGVTADILAGLFGIGGGLVIVPLLVLIFGFDPKMAVGTAEIDAKPVLPETVGGGQ
jgi:uncharacterized protein